MEWGTELWDKYGELCTHTNGGIEFLENTVSAFVKERGKIEADYAKSLRSLVKKYTPKESPVSNGSSARGSSKDPTVGSGSGPMSIMSINAPPEEEYSHMKAFKQVLKEVGFIAGQHEVLYESFSKENYKTIQEQVKKLKESRRKIMKEADRLNEDLKKAFKNMEASKEKFRKALEEQEKATAAYEKANMDGTISRNELEKLRLLASTKSSHCDTLKCKFASQLVQTNDFQSKYYYILLPEVLNHFQEMDQSRIALVRDSLMSCVVKEKEVSPIIKGCHEAIVSALELVNPMEDTEILIERLKSGDVPPGDFKFEDMRDSQAMLRTDAISDNRATNLNLYPRKRELEKQISGVQNELTKCFKELDSFQKMEATYRSNPKFGNSNQLRAEMDQVQVKIRELEAALEALRREHTAVESRLGSLRSRSPRPPTNRNEDSPEGVKRGSRSGSSNDSGSIKSSSLSIGSSAITSTSQAVYDIPENEYNRQMDEVDNVDEWSDDEMPPPPPPPSGPSEHVTSSSPSVISSASSSMSTATTGSLSFSSVSSRRCFALYDYNDRQSMQDCNLPMEEGEELLIVEEDCEGWTKVRRLIARPDEVNEGYVPSSYLKL